MLDGRVKSLHPRIHGGILFDRKNSSHQDQARQFGIPHIEVVAVNLYPFKPGTVIRDNNAAEAIELIDIGGPAMLRGAAKNFQNVIPVIDPQDYPEILRRLAEDSIDFNFRRQMAAKTFAWISSYDRSIADGLSDQPADGLLASRWEMRQKLRYGENPHQSAEVWLECAPGSSELRELRCLQGKELSYNNLLDIEAATQLCRDLPSKFAAVVVKHTNPCGVAIGADQLSTTLRRAIAADPVSAFGGIIALSKPVDEETAGIICEQFYECVVAPSFVPAALDRLAQKKNLRAVAAPFIVGPSPSGNSVRSLFDGFLRQDTDLVPMTPQQWRCVTSSTVTPETVDELLHAARICRAVKSNAIVLFAGDRTIGAGAGQMSRIDAAEIALKKARQHGHTIQGAVVASDAFFPFRDCIDLFAQHGIKAIVQPGGSMRDQESIDACNQHGIAMVFSGLRHFRH
jgi:phosphoribosylaminoimidazolecarboxamide formyltransferase/IMP cyclohydrolase